MKLQSMSKPVWFDSCDVLRGAPPMDHHKLHTYLELVSAIDFDASLVYVEYELLLPPIGWAWTDEEGLMDGHVPTGAGTQGWGSGDEETMQLGGNDFLLGGSFATHGADVLGNKYRRVRGVTQRAHVAAAPAPHGYRQPAANGKSDQPDWLRQLCMTAGISTSSSAEPISSRAVATAALGSRVHAGSGLAQAGLADGGWGWHSSSNATVQSRVGLVHASGAGRDVVGGVVEVPVEEDVPTATINFSLDIHLLYRPDIIEAGARAGLPGSARATAASVMLGGGPLGLSGSYPTIIFTVYARPRNGADRFIGCTTHTLLPEAGTASHILRTWQPRGSERQKLHNYFLGGGATHLQDLDYITPPHVDLPAGAPGTIKTSKTANQDGAIGKLARVLNRYGFRTDTSGALCIRTNTIVQGGAGDAADDMTDAGTQRDDGPASVRRSADFMRRSLYGPMTARKRNRRMKSVMEIIRTARAIRNAIGRPDIRVLRDQLYSRSIGDTGSVTGSEQGSQAPSFAGDYEEARKRGFERAWRDQYTGLDRIGEARALSGRQTSDRSRPSEHESEDWYPSSQRPSNYPPRDRTADEARRHRPPRDSGRVSSGPSSQRSRHDNSDPAEDGQMDGLSDTDPSELQHTAVPAIDPLTRDDSAPRRRRRTRSRDTDEGTEEGGDDVTEVQAF